MAQPYIHATAYIHGQSLFSQSIELYCKHVLSTELYCENVSAWCTTKLFGQFI